MNKYKYRQTNQVKTEKPDLKKMMRYTVKKILWVTNYSLSFSRKDETKELLIKLLGCVIILQSISVGLSFILKATQIASLNPLFSFSFLILFGTLVFKKELNSLFKLDKSENTKKEEIIV